MATRQVVRTNQPALNRLKVKRAADKRVFLQPENGPKAVKK